MTDNEIRDSWNFAKMIAINIGSVTLPKEDIVAIDDLINRQKAEIEELKSDIAILKVSNINLQELYQNEREKITKAKQKVIDACKMLKTARTEAITEFAERLKEAVLSIPTVYNSHFKRIVDRIKKEMKGE